MALVYPQKRHSFRADMRVVLDNLKKIVRKMGGRVEDTPSDYNYIRFILNGYMYYFQTDDNPLFSHYYTKTKIVDGKYSLDAGLDDLSRVWLNKLGKWTNNTDEVLAAVAEDLYTSLVLAQDSEIIRDKEKRRVPNSYDNGTHIEIVLAPERFAEVDF